MMRVGFFRSFNRQGYEVFVHQYTATGRVPFRITVEKLPELPPAAYAEPSAFLDMPWADEVINALLDGLQEAGLMPKMGATDAELKATLRHLGDMRSLVFESVPPKQDMTK